MPIYPPSLVAYVLLMLRTISVLEQEGLQRKPSCHRSVISALYHARATHFFGDNIAYARGTLRERTSTSWA